ncbi:MAG TPA: hypothetical protein VHY09_12970 [Candidatus Methylacidiphilales bacterium]|nr:hypothetical protein [Candidatus Methylacidiphilales bacterium]
MAKPADKLTPSDWKKYPVWTFDLDNESAPGRDETWMVPAKKLPVSDLRNCGCRANARLASGREIDAVLWNIRLQSDPKEEELWKNFARLQISKGSSPFVPKLQYSVWVRDRWWVSENDGGFMSLVDFKKRNASDMANALGETLDEIFPISYDISALASGPAAVVKGKIFGPKT